MRYLLLQGDTWFDNLRILGIKRALCAAGFHGSVVKTNRRYDVPGVDDHPNLSSILIDEFTPKNVARAVQSTLQHEEVQTFSSNEELTLLAAEMAATFVGRLRAPDVGMAKLAVDKLELKEWCSKEGLSCLPGFGIEKLKTITLQWPPNRNVIVKPRRGRGTIPISAWDYTIWRDVHDLYVAANKDTSILTENCFVEQYMGFGGEVVFYDVHVYFFERGKFEIFLVGQFIANSEGRITDSYGPIDPNPEVLLDIERTVAAISKSGYLHHPANLQFVVSEDRANLIDFNSRCAGVWSLIQPLMAPHFFDELLAERDQDLRSTILPDRSCYFKSHFPLREGKTIKSIEWKKYPDWSLEAYTEHLVPGYRVPQAIHSLQPSPQIATFGRSIEECRDRLTTYYRDVVVEYEN